MAELADALDSGSSVSNNMRVQVPSLAPSRSKVCSGLFFCLLLPFCEKLCLAYHLAIAAFGLTGAISGFDLLKIFFMRFTRLAPAFCFDSFYKKGLSVQAAVRCFLRDRIRVGTALRYLRRSAEKGGAS